MNRDTLRKIHAAAGAGACLFIASFWISTVLSELFSSHETIVVVKQTIVYALFGLMACMAVAGVTGMKMGGKSKHTAIAAKRRRMPFIAANGMLILLPCAFFLNNRASAGQFDSVFYIVPIVELIAGVANLTLLGLSMKDGFSIRKPKVKSA